MKGGLDAHRFPIGKKVRYIKYKYPLLRAGEAADAVNPHGEWLSLVWGKEASRLEMILAYRSFGLPVAQLPPLLDRKDEATQEHILNDQFAALEKEIQRLRLQQKAIVHLLKKPELLEEDMVTKDRWVEIMRAAGLSDQDMHNWHKQFEQMEPDAHQEFLDSLSIGQDEVKKIRSWSKD